MSKHIGHTIRFSPGVPVLSSGNVGGKMEGAGPLGEFFDELEQDSFFGQDTWEAAESVMQTLVLQRALLNAGASPTDLDAVFGGDLLNQCTASAFAVRNVPVPFCGIYGACSTMGEGLLLAASLIDGGQLHRAAVMTSSHFCAAERQYRMPVSYGSQRSPTAQWTATAAGCCILGRQGDGPRITAATIGCVTDLGVTDATNMGAAMAPAAIRTIEQHFRDTGTSPADYDRIFTGDLGAIGHGIVVEQMGSDGYDMSKNYNDCGLLLYDRQKQDMHAGGSGAGCCAGVLCGYILTRLRQRVWKRVLFAPTGALLSPTTTFQKESIPAVCHAVVLEASEGA